MASLFYILLLFLWKNLELTEFSDSNIKDYKDINTYYYEPTDLHDTPIKYIQCW